MFNQQELEQLLEQVGAKIEKSLRIYLIGGCALSFKGLKSATKDIDIIVKNKSDFEIFDNSMKLNGFVSMTDRETEFYLTALAVYTKEESRIDVFLAQVGKMLFLTKTMISRAKIYKTYSKLSVYLLSDEDIFLFKAMTSREGDIFDCDRLMKEGLDYDIIYNEIVEQSKEEGKRWFFWAYENLCRLENYNSIKTPLKNKILALIKKHWNERPADFMKNVDNKQEHLPDKRLLEQIDI